MLEIDNVCFAAEGLDQVSTGDRVLRILVVNCSPVLGVERNVKGQIMITWNSQGMYRDGMD